ncbi:energy transducer TonB [Paraburkholderia sp. 31.1]|nr:energy transducer TonB [Paraburkholderia sp. 31.1]
MRASVDERGQISDAVVEVSSGNPAFDNLALQASRRAQCSALTGMDNQPVAVETNFVFNLPHASGDTAHSGAGVAAAASNADSPRPPSSPAGATGSSLLLEPCERPLRRLAQNAKQRQHDASGIRQARPPAVGNERQRPCRHGAASCDYASAEARGRWTSWLSLPWTSGVIVKLNSISLYVSAFRPSAAPPLFSTTGGISSSRVAYAKSSQISGSPSMLNCVVSLRWPSLLMKKCTCAGRLP